MPERSSQIGSRSRSTAGYINSTTLLPNTRIPIRREGNISLSELMLIDNDEDSSILSYDQQEQQEEALFHEAHRQPNSSSSAVTQQGPYSGRSSGFVNFSTHSLTNQSDTIRPTTRTLPVPTTSRLTNRRAFGPHSLNNTILRSAANSETPPFLPHLVFPESANSNFHSTSTRSPDFENRNRNNFISDINRHSTESLLNDMSAPSNTSNVFFDLTHSGHLRSETEQSTLSLDSRLSIFLEKRQRQGVEFDEHSKAQKTNASKKRRIDEVDGATNEPYKHHKFESIRPQLSSFLKPGITFTGKSKTYKLSLITTDYKSGVVSGVLKFKNDKVKNKKLKKFLNPNNKKQHDGLLIPFKGQTINFEDEDLRFHSSLQDDFEKSLRETMNTFNRSKEFYNIYNNCLVRKQLSRWMMFKPFNNLTIGKLLPCITCEHCLEKLQSQYILFRLYVDTDSQIPDMLCCIDRTNGQLEVVTSESVKKSISEHMLLEREISHYDKEECKVLKMRIERAYYTSSSVQLT